MLLQYVSLARPGGEVDDWEEHYVGIFVDRDMFMRYNPFGVGHPVSIRKITRDCLGSGAPADAMDVVNDDADHEEVDDGEGLGEFNDEQEGDYAFSDEELEDEDGEDNEDGGDNEDEGGDGNEFDDLSF
ncbi:hypothetical protein DEU56DRAFT_919696 [Suillus clintonianus]|uniref:uncharacterized protein n=1 Tax=Suillus clintonianus TaxID=1904413 RepID=UPI001B88344F|nr:uncharacterized protein DEU56DRAFT_919696 [Suillus clintonianus]KAG2113688.1 hypothetical protein DEU56DRAFT_919696 [Suillus clintonianus]